MIKPQASALTPTHYATVGALLIVMFAAGAAAGYSGRPAAASQTPLRESGFQYIRPVLVCNVEPQPQNEDAKLSGLISNYVKKSATQDVGVYYANPGAGKWAGYNQNESYSPASMLKVPIMVAVLRVAEEDPALLNKQVLYDGSFDDNALETIKPAQALLPGRYYSVDDLLTYMIVYSDNNAADLLQNTLTPAQFEDIYTDLGLAVPSASGPVDFMSPKTFTLFLRVLFNSSYLSHELSEKALALMVQSQFPQGLEAGVPQGVAVANKFGERQADTGSGLMHELHDCGIIYADKSPYFLCVMTRGADPTALAQEIAGISSLVYNYAQQ